MQTFVHWAELSGLVPMVGINNGYCFAGNAAILGCCDIIISTEGSNIGMGKIVILSRFCFLVSLTPKVSLCQAARQ